MVRDLARMVTGIKDARQAEDVLRALLTPRELEKIALRWRLVRLLEAGESQRRIAEELGISLCKITRGSRELKYGPEGFRRMVKTFLAGEQPGE